MRSVHIKAGNIRPGDVLNGRRVMAKHRHDIKPSRRKTRQKGEHGVVVLLPSTHGYALDVEKFNSEEKIVVKRPKYNMRYAKK